MHTQFGSIRGSKHITSLVAARQDSEGAFTENASPTSINSVLWYTRRDHKYDGMGFFPLFFCCNYTFLAVFGPN